MKPNRAIESLALAEGITDDDVAFVLSTWAESFRHAPACKPMPTTAFHRWHRPRMLEILARKPLVVVARDSTNPGFIYGYGVFERLGPTLVAHWVYTKRNWRRDGIASRILAHALERIGQGATDIVMTHRTYIEPHAASLGFRFVKLESLYADAQRAEESA